jgi:predicted ATPase/class 3 adenylate cyclase
MRDSRELPSGIVTFVFSDIEGSTRLFHQLGEQYVEVLERHRQILREAWTAHRGREVSTDGDAFFVAFEGADDAVWACVDAQRALAEETWPNGTAVKVRMGVHTGLATPYEGDYVAVAVHQAARVVAAGHGGQILVSEEAAAQLALPDASGLRPLGHFRLRDFDQPELLYQVYQDGLPADFPAVRALPADGHNLVRQPNETIGRDELIVRLAGEIQPGRVVTLVGPGGVGKSRVAGEVGMRIASDWTDGVWRVDLATITEHDPMVAAIGEAVGAPARPGGDRWAEILDHLSGRRAVLIFDNCEHLLDSCRELIGALLAACGGVAVVATSREPIRLPGEVLRPVPPLPLPDPNTPADRIVLMSPAVRLFVERGQAVRQGFTIDDRNAAPIIAICRHLDGLPLSLELAAANLAVQSPAEILAGLEDRFRLLQSRDRDPEDRHHTMEGVLEWSFRMLGDTEQVAFRRVAVFGSSFSLETATSAVAGERIDPHEVPQLIWSLVDRSLVTAELAADATRYSLLETIQTYGRDRLDEAGETGLVAYRVAEHLLDRMGPWSPADRRWQGEVGVELGNLRVLVPLTAAGSPELAQQLACTIGRYHDSTASYQAGIDELARYATVLGQPTSVRASLLTTLADLHLRTGDTDSAAADSAVTSPPATARSRAPSPPPGRR